MKIHKIIFIFLLGALCFYAPKILAIKETSFPDSNTLQPMPIETMPNISGNIEWPNNSQNQNTAQNATTDTTGESADQNNPESSATSPNTTSSNITNNQNNPPNEIANNNSQNSNSADTTLTKLTTNQSVASQPSSNKQKFDPSNPFSYFDTMQAQNNSQAQNAPAENTDAQDNSTNSVTNQNNTQPQDASPQLSYTWIIILGLITLLVATFMIWRLRKTR